MSAIKAGDGNLITWEEVKFNAQTPEFFLEVLLTHLTNGKNLDHPS